MRIHLLTAALSALFLVVGCAKGGSYRLNVRDTGTAPEGVWQEGLYEIVGVCAAEQGYQLQAVTPATKGPPSVAEYSATGLGPKQTGGSHLIVQQPDAFGVNILMTVSPASDYPTAKQLRANLKRQLTEEFGPDAVSGF